MPLSRTDECHQCHADLHVCKLCEFYDASVSNSCREPIANEVKNKERANFCDYFKIKPSAFVPGDLAKRDAARAALDALFGNSTSSQTGISQTTSGDKAISDLEDLFKK